MPNQVPTDFAGHLPILGAAEIGASEAMAPTDFMSRNQLVAVQADDGKFPALYCTEVEPSGSTSVFLFGVNGMAHGFFLHNCRCDQP